MSVHPAFLTESHGKESAEVKFSIAPACYRRTFSVPLAAAQKANLASAPQLRALLLLFSETETQEEMTPQILAQALHTTEETAEEALLFWEGEGILVRTDAPAAPADPAPLPPQEVSPLPRVTDTLTGKPTRAEAVRRGTEDPEIRILLQDIQIKFSRTLSSQEMVTLVWIHDTLGLPTPVILMLAEQQVLEGHTGLRWLEKTAVDWASQEINTVEKAEETLQKIAMSKKSWHLVRTVFGIGERKPSKKELEFSRVWVQEWGFGRQMLSCAYDACIDHAGKVSFPYINKVLQAWQESGIHTPAQLEAAQKTAPRSSENPAGASFTDDDLNALLHSGL